MGRKNSPPKEKSEMLIKCIKSDDEKMNYYSENNYCTKKNWIFGESMYEECGEEKSMSILSSMT